MKISGSFAIILILTLANASLAREGRGEHKTDVWCTISTEASAEDCIKRVAQNMPTENDDNAAFLVKADPARENMNQVLKAIGHPEDMQYVMSASFIGIVVQNDDEPSLYYYAIKQGVNQPRLLGDSLAIVDMGYDVCDGTWPAFMGSVQGLLMGADPNKSLVGTVWFEDLDCEYW